MDEAAEWQEESILFLLSRMRGSNYKKPMQLILTCNPSRTSYLYEWVKPLLDKETGIPVKGSENIVRYFVNLGGKMIWGTDPQAMFEEYGEPKGLVFGETFNPMSSRFIFMTIEDNPIIRKNNPNYVSQLLQMSPQNQARFLYGSWNSLATGEALFDRQWVKMIDYIPLDWKITGRVRSWDLAASPEAEEGMPKSTADYTAGVKICRTSTGAYIVEDAIRFRKHTGEVISSIVNTAFDDGLEECKVTVPRDAGAGGVSFNQYLIRTLAEHGVPASSVKMSGHSSKLSRAQCFLSLAQSGNVYVVRGDWNDMWFTELENFQPNIRSSLVKDDLVDATSDAANTLGKQVMLPTFTLPDLTRPSLTAGVF